MATVAETACYTSRTAKKKATLETLAEQITKIDRKIDTLYQRMERGFAAVAEDIGDIREKMATNEQIIALHTHRSVQSKTSCAKRSGRSSSRVWPTLRKKSSVNPTSRKTGP